VDASEAVARGAVVGTLAAFATVCVAAALLSVNPPPGSTWAGPPRWEFAVPSMLGGGVVGSALGALAARIRGSVRRRTLILLAWSPAGPFVLAVATFVAWSLTSVPGGAAAVRLPTLEGVAMILFWPALAMWYLAPVYGPPVVLGHLVLEGWTRPASLPATGFARPDARRVVLQVFAAACVVCAVIALS
jgi:hypothetical protein